MQRQDHSAKTTCCPHLRFSQSTETVQIVPVRKNYSESAAGNLRRPGLPSSQGGIVLRSACLQRFLKTRPSCCPRKESSAENQNLRSAHRSTGQCRFPDRCSQLSPLRSTWIRKDLNIPSSTEHTEPQRVLKTCRLWSPSPKGE